MIDDKQAFAMIDWYAKHRIFSRLIVVSVLITWVYMGINEIKYFEVATYLLGVIFLAITFGLNFPEKFVQILKAYKK